ncbi:MAG: SDR family NAD(P)-dependent oxidoreductase, partial [Gemmatimonadetes bacterium]|nr:SDR family NAD(P)-dependent oxidoreductase [Gemmatimonadota bacterium]
MSGWLDGKAALVTGGGSGIGRAVVEAFVAEGARVCVLEYDPSKCAELREVGDRVMAVEGDATSYTDNQRAVGAAVEAFGGLDTLVTLVGVHDSYARLTDIPEDRLEAAFDEAFGTNVKSVLFAVRSAEPELARRNGSVIVTGSSSSFYPGRGGVLYVGSKFALRGVIVQLAHELAPAIRVNGVAPGGTLGTDLRGLVSLGQSHQRLADRTDREAALRARTPLSVALNPEDHAAAYVYLAS